MGSLPTARRADAATALADAVAELLLGRVRMTSAAMKMAAAVRNGEGEEDDDGDKGAGGGRRYAPATYVPTLTYLHLPGGVFLLTLSLVMTRTPPTVRSKLDNPLFACLTPRFIH